MQKKKYSVFEMLYIIYCRKITGFVVDPLCAVIVYSLIDIPIKNPFLSGFVYICTYIIIRIPMMFYYNDV